MLQALLNNQFILGTVVALAVWTYHKVRGDHQESIADLATGFARQAVAQIADDPNKAASASAWIEAKILDGLAAALHVPTSKLGVYKPIIDPIVAHAVADLMEEAKRRAEVGAQIQANLNALAAAAEKVQNAFRPVGLNELANVPRPAAAP